MTGIDSGTFRVAVVLTGTQSGTGEYVVTVSNLYAVELSQLVIFCCSYSADCVTTQHLTKHRREVIVTAGDSDKAHPAAAVIAGAGIVAKAFTSALPCVVYVLTDSNAHRVVRFGGSWVKSSHRRRCH